LIRARSILTDFLSTPEIPAALAPFLRALNTRLMG